MGKSQSSKYKRMGRAADRHSTRRGLPSGQKLNTQHKLPPRVAAMFNELLSDSLHLAGETQQIQRATAEAHAKFRREQAKLMDSLAQQLGISGVLRDFVALRKRRVAQVRDAMEKAQTAIARRAKGLREFEEK